MFSKDGPTEGKLTLKFEVRPVTDADIEKHDLGDSENYASVAVEIAVECGDLTIADLQSPDPRAYLGNGPVAAMIAIVSAMVMNEDGLIREAADRMLEKAKGAQGVIEIMNESPEKMLEVLNRIGRLCNEGSDSPKTLEDMQPEGHA